MPRKLHEEVLNNHYHHHLRLSTPQHHYVKQKRVDKLLRARDACTQEKVSF